MKKGLVLEGGALRGLFTAGILDVLMENGVRFDGLVGVSAGAAFGCNYKSGQAGRVIRYNKRFAHEWRYCSWRSWIATGDLFGGEFCYHKMPDELDVFDKETFDSNPMEYYAVCTDVETGEAVYKRLMKCSPETYEYIRASASMPMVSNIVEVGGRKLLDGGVTDSIPLRFFQEQGYERNLVILTQPADYQKQHNRLMPILRLWLHRYPKMIEALDRRHEMYNQQLEYVREEERKGNTYVIRPPQKLVIGHISHDENEMQGVYQMGRRVGEGRLKDIVEFLEK
ncbi:MAG: patatin family protein [Prevotella sp.]|nr:patatin family protein [Prevotella sp.]